MREPIRTIVAFLSTAAMLLFDALPVSAAETVTLCHFPPGNPENPRTIEVSERAADAHFDHGDALGDCGTTSILCGNRVLDESEGCDPPDFGDRTCEDVLGPGATGTPGCTSSCELAAGSCQLCGNGIREGTELCDDGNDIPNDACNLCVTDEDHED